MRTGISFLLLLLAMICQSVSYASVVMSGTRVIFPAHLKEQTLRFSNSGQYPYIVQLQVDNNESASDGHAGSADFIASPPVFRIEPNKGQSVRLVFTGDNVATDRETLFYLSFTQLPVMKPEEQKTNYMVLAVTSRLKLFYRPESLSKKPVDVAANLVFRMQGNNLIVENPTGYYAVIRAASINDKNHDYALATSTMIAPKSSVSWKMSKSVSQLSGAKVNLTMVNDYGVDHTVVRKL